MKAIALTLGIAFFTGSATASEGCRYMPESPQWAGMSSRVEAVIRVAGINHRVNALVEHEPGYDALQTTMLRILMDATAPTTLESAPLEKTGTGVRLTNFKSLYFRILPAHQRLLLESAELYFTQDQGVLVVNDAYRFDVAASDDIALMRYWFEAVTDDQPVDSQTLNELTQAFSQSQCQRPVDLNALADYYEKEPDYDPERPNGY